MTLRKTLSRVFSILEFAIRHGPSATLSRIFRLRRRGEIVRAVRDMRLQVGERLSWELGGKKVAYGPFKGLDPEHFDTWGAADIAPMLLGFYEREIVDLVCELGDGEKVLVDVGAAEGFYAVGGLFSKRFSKTICFEADSSTASALMRTAERNGVSDRITVIGEASDDFVEKVCGEIGDNLHDAVFLLDIEGDEVKICTRENLVKLRHTTLLIEIHDGFFDDKTISDFEYLCREFFLVSEIRAGSRDPNSKSELSGWSDAERWLACSEGRPYQGRWLILTPQT